MNRRNQYTSQSGQGGQNPERFPQQEWSGDDYRGGHDYRADRPYSGDEQDDASSGYGRGMRGASGGNRPYGREFSQSQGGYASSQQYVGNRQGGNWEEDDTYRGSQYGSGTRGEAMGYGDYESERDPGRNFGGRGGGNQWQSGTGGYGNDRSYSERAGTHRVGAGYGGSGSSGGARGDYVGGGGYQGYTQSGANYGDGGYAGYGGLQGNRGYGASGQRGYGSQGGYGDQSSFYSGQRGYGGSAGGQGGDYGYGRSTQGQGGYSAGYEASGPRDFGQQRGSAGMGGSGGYGMSGGAYGGTRMSSGYGTQGYGGAGQGLQGFGTQGYSGRGPKGYTRSDDRLKEDINERLTDDPEIDASDISIEVSSGKVTLSGQVEERWMKHHVEDLVDRCSGVQDIDNRLAVSRNRGSSGMQSGSGYGSSTSSSSMGTSGSAGYGASSAGRSSDNESTSGRSGTTGSTGSSTTTTGNGGSTKKQ